MHNKIFVIFSGYNQRAIIAFIRTLEKNNLAYGIIASSKSDPILLTKYKKNVYFIRKRKNLFMEDVLSGIKAIGNTTRKTKFIIAPSTEALNRFLLKNKDELEKKEIEIPLVSEKLYENISDKYSFSNLCEKNNILIPREYKNINDIKYPYVAKPKNYFDSSGMTNIPVLIFTKNDETNFKNNFNLNEFYYQEFIGGKSFYLLYYFSKDGTVYKFSQKNYIQQPLGKSILAAESSNLHKNKISKKFEDLFSLINFSGLVMIELKEYSGKYYMIEANPRFWGPSQLFVDAKANLFEQFLFDCGALDTKPSFIDSSKKVKYFWLGGLVEILNKKEEVTYYDYTQDLFYENISEWINSDIYKRDDTSNIFIQETKNYRL